MGLRHFVKILFIKVVGLQGIWAAKNQFNSVMKYFGFIILTRSVLQNALTTTTITATALDRDYYDARGQKCIITYMKSIFLSLLLMKFINIS